MQHGMHIMKSNEAYTDNGADKLARENRSKRLKKFVNFYLLISTVAAFIISIIVLSLGLGHVLSLYVLEYRPQ